ncbi:MAG TPA: FAD-binding oxidoreductase [Mycobacteriales bacterium]|nr:FAD-binding oxidoreductase [Mycobacteriales bacterium]
MTTTPAAPATTPVLSTLDTLRRQAAGPVFAPDDPGYDAEIATFNQIVSHRPPVVVGAACADDVAATVRFALRHGLRVAVQATGHGASFAVEDGILVTTRRMDTVSIDVQRGVARIGAGAKWAAVIAAAAPYGLAPLSGSTSDVGAVGYTLGGGMGPLGRRYGFAADRVRSVEIVTGDGRLRTLTADDDTGLFWAIRGGKGNLGIVTSMEVDLVLLPRLYGGAIFFDAADTAAVVHAWREWVATVPEEMTSSIALLRLPDVEFVPPPLRGRMVLHLRVAYIGEPCTGEKLVAPLRAVATPVLDMVRDMPFSEVDSIHLDPTDPMPAWHDGRLLSAFTAEAADALVAAAGPDADVPLIFAEVRHMGGALARQAAVPNAVAGRDAAFSLFVLGPGMPAIRPAVSAAGTAVIDALAPWHASGRLVNFLGTTDDGAAAVASAYRPEDAARLVELTERFDPHGLFRYGHSLRGR